MEKRENRVLIAGAGPAGLFCAYQLIEADIPVLLADRMAKPGRKFLLAGSSGGLNCTHQGTPAELAEQYYGNEMLFKNLLTDFSPDDTIKWYKSIHSDTFIGNGGKIFTKSPVQEVLHHWLEHLSASPFFEFKSECEFTGFGKEPGLFLFRQCGKQIEINAQYAVFALGGGSRPETGSDGAWVKPFQKAGIQVAPLQSANCGVEANWSPVLKEKISQAQALGQTSLDIALDCSGRRTAGEVVLTGYGLEGSGVYSIGYYIRQSLEKDGCCHITADLLPHLTHAQLVRRLEKPRGKNSLSNYARKALGISGLSFALFRELESNGNLMSIKALPLTITGCRPLKEAISSAGGVCLSQLDSNFMLKKLPGCFVVGEMADWEAPTGGYLLQGCFSTAYRAAKQIIDFIS